LITTEISYGSYRFPPETIQWAIWLYIRFTPSFRDVEDLLAERGIMVSKPTTILHPRRRASIAPPATFHDAPGACRNA
jgi:transposase-like protein